MILRLDSKKQNGGQIGERGAKWRKWRTAVTYKQNTYRLPYSSPPSLRISVGTSINCYWGIQVQFTNCVLSLMG